MDDEELVAAIRQATAEAGAEFDALWDNPSPGVNMDSEDIALRYFNRVKDLLDG